MRKGPSIATALPLFSFLGAGACRVADLSARLTGALLHLLLFPADGLDDLRVYRLALGDQTFDALDIQLNHLLP